MIVKFSGLTNLYKSLQKNKVVFASGTFDLVHRGHIIFFKNLKEYGDTVVIAISSDERVRQRKGNKRPILLEKDRLALVDAIKYVDYCLVAPQPSKGELQPTIRIIKTLRPNVFITNDRKWLRFREEVESFGVKFKVITRVKVNSTTRIINRIIKRYSK